MAIELQGLFFPLQAAKILGIGQTTIFRWLKSGKIAFLVVGGQRVIPQSEIDRAKTLIDEGKLKRPGNRLPRKKKDAQLPAEVHAGETVTIKYAGHYDEAKQGLVSDRPPRVIKNE